MKITEKIKQEKQIIEELIRDRNEKYQKLKDFCSVDYLEAEVILRKTGEINSKIKSAKNRIKKLKANE